MHITTRTTSDTANTRELHVSLTGGLRTPLSVLRATLETLAHRFDDKDPRRAQLDAALAQVARVQHNLQAVLDAEQAPALRPLSCTLHEIVQSAIHALVPEHQARTLVAVEGAHAHIVVDGPLVSRALTRLIESSLDQSTEPALLRVRAHGGQARFVVLHTASDAPAGSIERLAHELAQRDIERMSGSFISRVDADRTAAVEIAFTLAAAGEEAA